MKPLKNYIENKISILKNDLKDLDKYKNNDIMITRMKTKLIIYEEILSLLKED